MAVVAPAGVADPHAYASGQYGVGSVPTTPGEAVRWADDCRTGRIGGTELLAGVTDGAVRRGDVPRPRGIEERCYGPDNFRAANRLLDVYVWTK
ncbi:hypothetical protein [Streptomyces sp. NPDC058295]|uniref:hypothetical protein n=1 Tax=Streptomyces sp. NPDC058295 TaxID=3346431 RepID=UPI0036EFE41A